MNKAILIGRLTRDPDIRKSTDTMVARYTLAVDRFKDGADFISCVAFGKSAEFADKYLKKGSVKKVKATATDTKKKVWIKVGTKKWIASKYTVVITTTV